ncbi:hypothetical protein BBD39_06060 [Arsenophonus endosymbiont of Bemisia tabaci Asia II 3]|nr:hypothetical protein BBD39_06060 [Arsenophonus endosymbiont of Bemisia tabaci Asia II 3]
MVFEGRDRCQGLDVEGADEVVDGMWDVPAGAVKEVEGAKEVEGTGFLDWCLGHLGCTEVVVSGEGS